MMRSPPPASPSQAERVGAQLAVAPDASHGGRFAFTGSLRTRAARGTIINSVFTVALGLLTLLRGFVLAAYLSPADFGVWGVLAVSFSTLLFLKQAGVGDKFVQQQEADQEAAFQKAFTIELALSVASVVLIAVALPLLILIFNLPQLLWPGVVIAGVLVVSAFQAPLWIYYRRMEFVRQRALQAVDPVVGFVAAVGLSVAGAGYWAFVGGMAAGTCAASAAAVWRSPFALRLRWERGSMRQYWSFSAPLLLAAVAGSVMAWSAALAAKLELGVPAVGVITLAYTVVSFTDSVDQLMTGALYPAICAVKERTEVLYESLVKSNRLTLMWGVPFGIGVTLFASDLVRFVLGERWHAAILLLQVYGITAAVNHVGFNWTAYFRAIGRTRPIAVVTIAAATIFVLAGIPLLVAFGLPGFAAGVAAQALGSLILRAYYLQQLFPGFDFLRHAARAFLPTVPAVALVALVRLLGSGDAHTFAAALGQFAGYVAVTLAVTWYFERRLLREALQQVLGRPVAAVAT